MDWVIASIKQCYQTDLRTLANENDNVTQLYKKMLLDAIYSTSKAWFSMNPLTVV
jgi:hypothetical protein